MAATVQMGHVGLNVSDLGRSKKFYQDLLGFEVKLESEERGRKFILLGRGPAILLTLWEQAKGGYAPGQAGLHHLSFQVDHMDEVRSTEGRLRSQGIDFHYSGVVPHAHGTASGDIFFRDPDGIRLELFAPTGAEGLPAPKGDLPSCGFF
ncbi:MAG TPA: VOC family protein [Planctomycetota bacterium]|nr:VOC family protein [Planctomycetota bacterium]